MKIKKIIILENIKSNELSLVFSKIVSKGLCWDKVWGISIFPSCTPIRGIYRKALLRSSVWHMNKSGTRDQLAPAPRTTTIEFKSDDVIKIKLVNPRILLAKCLDPSQL